MLKTVSKISLFLFLLAVPFLFLGFGIETFNILLKFSPTNPRWQYFLLGVAVFVPCYFIGKRFFYSTWSYLETLEHELTHLLIGLLFLKIPVGIRVSAHAGGEVRQIGFGTTGQIWVTLAPYFFPTVSLFVVIIGYFASLNSLILLAILGWTTAFHLVSNWSETSFRQPDLQKAGFLQTILILPVMNLMCYGAVLAYVVDGGRGFQKFWFAGFRHSYDFMLDFLQIVRIF
jgi:hypothetical protein